MFAMYVPRLLDGGVVFRMLLLVGLAASVVLYLRPRYGLRLALAFVVVGWAIAVLPGLLYALRRDLREYGDICREWNQVGLPDAVFSAYMYFDVGLGTVFSFLGIVAGGVVLGAGGWLLKATFFRARLIDKNAT